MKRYFLISKEKLIFYVSCNKKALELTLEDLRATTNVASLEEITEEEYNRLEKLYSPS